MARVTRLGGRVLVIDQIAPVDPLAAIELDRFERARDPSHTRLLSGHRRPLAARGERPRPPRLADQDQESRDLDGYLDLAGCEGDARRTAASVAPPQIVATIGWYLAAKPMP